MRRNIFKNSQGVVESVVAVGILMMMLTGTVLLVSFGLSNRKTGFDRRKANELATLVMEEEVGKSISNPGEFWQFSYITDPQTRLGFGGYSYTLNYSTINSDPDYPNCIGGQRPNCAQLVVNIGWSGKETQNLKFERFFSR